MLWSLGVYEWKEGRREEGREEGRKEGREGGRKGGREEGRKEVYGCRCVVIRFDIEGEM